MSHKFLAGAGLLVLAGWGGSDVAVASDIKQVDMTLRILVDGPPPCSVKGSAVEFGNVVINKIDGTSYRQDAKYTLNCGNKVSDDLQMQLKGNTTVINGETVLSTDIAGLGVRIENAADN
ncbi:fimbrial protein, partial [Escherichia coli]|nr:fimbrial protein [Escherichia coli]HAX4944232.1 fimbrial protein [Escherichia coli]